MFESILKKAKSIGLTGKRTTQIEYNMKALGNLLVLYDEKKESDLFILIEYYHSEGIRIRLRNESQSIITHLQEFGGFIKIITMIMNIIERIGIHNSDRILKEALESSIIQSIPKEDIK